MKLHINRINKRRFQVKHGDNVLRECTSYKEALNALMCEDMRTPDDDEFFDTELDDMELIEFYQVA